MKKMVFLLLLFFLVGCANTGDSPDVPDVAPPLAIEVGVLNGATGLSAAWLMDYADGGGTVDDYHFTVATAPDQLTAALLSGQVQIAALPTNVAALLYNRSEGMVQLAAITTYGLLYVLENGDEVASIDDLRGRTIHTTGQGANPEFILNHILTENGLTPGVDVFIEFHPNEALATQMAAGLIDLSMMPEPMVSSVLAQNEDVRVALDVTDAWNALDDTSPLVMSAIVVRTDFAAEHPDAVVRFLALLERSISETLADPEAVAPLIAELGIIPSAAVAARAIFGVNLTFITGADMPAAIVGFLEVLLLAYPAAIGGALPSDAFYFVAP